MAKPNLRAFTDAARMHGLLKHYDLGGPVSNAPATPSNAMAAPSLASATQSPLPLSNFIGNNSFQAQLAPTTSYNYNPGIGTAQAQALQGYNQTQSNIGSEQALQQQLTQEGMGQGPN